MRVVVFQPEPLYQYPPTISLLSVLCDNHDVTFVSCSDNSVYGHFFKSRNIDNIDIVKKFRFRQGLFPALIERRNNLAQIWEIIRGKRSEKTLIWLATEKAAVYLGEKVQKERYVMQLMELLQIEKVNSIYPFGPRVNLRLIAQKARLLVVPEYNRSRIQSVWWNLNIPSVVLPNKQELHPGERKMNIKNKKAKDTIDEIVKSGKKIILYQGVFHKQRSLVPFVKACEKVSDRYVFLMLGAYNQAVKDLLDLSPVVRHIDWIEAPGHLEVTSWAHIGILTYIPGKMNRSSELNALYCAPNKIFEYSGFGIPMLANDCPPLKTEFEKWNIGRIVNLADITSIVEGISIIEENYNKMQSNCLDFFDSINIKEIVNDIISIAAKG